MGRYVAVTWLLQGAGPPGGVGAGSDGGEARDNMCLDMVQTRAGGQEGQNCDQAASHAVPDGC